MPNDALKVLIWLLVLPVGISYVMLVAEARAVEVYLADILIIASILVVTFAPEHCPKRDPSEPDTSLPSILARARGLAGGLAVAAAITFPGAAAKAENFMSHAFSLGGLVVFALMASTFHIVTLFQRRSELIFYVKSGVRAIIASAFLAFFLGAIQGLTVFQVLCLSVVIFGVIVNLIWPINERLNEAVQKASPKERIMLRSIERYSFALGITVIFMLPSRLTESSSEVFIVTAIIIGICHWLYTRDRDVYCGLQR